MVLTLGVILIVEDSASNILEPFPIRLSCYDRHAYYIITFSIVRPNGILNVYVPRSFF